MEDKNFSHTIWEKRTLKKLDLEEKKENIAESTSKNVSNRNGGFKKIRLVLFFLLFIFVVFYVSFVFLKNKDRKLTSEPVAESENQKKGSIAVNLFNVFKNLSLSNNLQDGGVKGFNLGEEESVPMSILKFVPDGHISKIEKDGNITLFISAHDKTYLMQGRTLKDTSLLTDANGLPRPILQPELSGFDKDYAGFGQVIENPQTNDFIGLYHTEVRVNPDASDSQLTSIALALSRDNGFTWQKMGRIITGQNIAALGTIVSGAGQPSGVLVGDYIYLYFSDWNRLIADSIHLARAPLSQNGMPGTWEKYTEIGFSQVGMGGKSTPVIVPFAWDKKIYYTANPSVSFNQHLNKHLAVFETNIGFFSAVSDDGINWVSFEMIFEFPKDTIIPKETGDIWYSYPTLLSEGTPTDMITGKTGYLYYGRGVFGDDHQLVRRPFVIE